jgi:hypothetical protein
MRPWFQKAKRLDRAYAKNPLIITTLELIYPESAIARRAAEAPASTFNNQAAWQIRSEKDFICLQHAPVFGMTIGITGRNPFYQFSEDSIGDGDLLPFVLLRGSALRESFDFESSWRSVLGWQHAWPEKDGNCNQEAVYKLTFGSSRSFQGVQE